jgi:hypothetical protein
MCVVGQSQRFEGRPLVDSGYVAYETVEFQICMCKQRCPPKRQQHSERPSRHDRNNAVLSPLACRGTRVKSVTLLCFKDNCLPVNEESYSRRFECSAPCCENFKRPVPFFRGFKLNLTMTKNSALFCLSDRVLIVMC